MGIWAIIISWLILAIIFGSGSDDSGNNPQIIKRKEGIKMKYIPTLDTPITVKGLIDAYGKDKATIIIGHQINHTIIMKQRQMRAGNAVYNVLLKDPIAGKLIIKTDHVLRLEQIGENNKRRDWFTQSEINTMRKFMPGFDKYYEIRRVGFDNE